MESPDSGTLQPEGQRQQAAKTPASKNRQTDPQISRGWGIRPKMQNFLSTEWVL
jgi:hypothetical protein